VADVTASIGDFVVQGREVLPDDAEGVGAAGLILDARERLDLSESTSSR
jgi:hypothetical protein